MAKSRNTLEFIFEDDNYIVINKPSGVSSLDEHVFSTPSVLELLRRKFPEAQLCHRLDKETSGCLLAAKNPDAYKYAAVLFEKRKVQKRYVAIVNGNSNFVDFKVDLPLFTVSKRVRVSHKQGKESLTFLNTIENFRNFSVVDCNIITGRMHQIRVHLSEQNFPIINDTLYGGKPPMLSQIKRHFNLSKKQEEETPIISRIGLHARLLKFESFDGKIIEVEAPLDRDLNALLKILRKYDSLKLS